MKRTGCLGIEINVAKTTVLSAIHSDSSKNFRTSVRGYQELPGKVKR